MKFLGFILAVVALGMAGLFGWYGSLHPCDMLMKDSLRNVQKGSGEGDFFSSLERIFSPVGMSPGECIQALAKLHLGAPEAREASTTETKPDRVAKKEHKHATKKGELEQLRAVQKKVQNLATPPTKGDAPENEPGYNSRTRGDMRRAIEGVTGSEEGAQ